MIDPGQLLKYVIRPVLKQLGLWSYRAERLVLGTACQESECGRWLHQLGNGPALGIYQMEPPTHDDLWANFIDKRPELKAKIMQWQLPSMRDATEMAGNLYYATAMCRIHYYRRPEGLPDTLKGQAHYYKLYFNSIYGAATEDQYISNWQRFVDEKIFA